mgnify:CR=1 FL=1
MFPITVVVPKGHKNTEAFVSLYVIPIMIHATIIIDVMVLNIVIQKAICAYCVIHWIVEIVAVCRKVVAVLKEHMPKMTLASSMHPVVLRRGHRVGVAAMWGKRIAGLSCGVWCGCWDCFLCFYGVGATGYVFGKGFECRHNV